ncbi:MAG: hypothetical protein J5636_05735, partial [Clostridiales bacterium]|nr:hypothetical protein [Clostridiales bacterium]
QIQLTISVVIHIHPLLSADGNVTTNIYCFGDEYQPSLGWDGTPFLIARVNSTFSALFCFQSSVLIFQSTDLLT